METRKNTSKLTELRPLKKQYVTKQTANAIKRGPLYFIRYKSPFKSPRLNSV